MTQADNAYPPDKRLTERYEISVPVKYRSWKSNLPERAGESLNISEGGICFVTHGLVQEGETIEIRFEMPQEVVDEPCAEWLCTGQVLKVEPSSGPITTFNVRVRFDCYEVARPNGTTTFCLDLNFLRFGSPFTGH